MALARFRFPDSSPSYTPEFPQGAALNHEPTALPLSYRGPYARFYGMNRSPITLDPTRPKWTYSFPRDSSNDRGRSFPLLAALVRRQSHTSLNARRAAASSASAPALRRLDSRTFLRGVVERIQKEIPADFPPIHSTAYSYMAAFRARERAIRRGLGADVRIETWDRGWARVWEPIALATLDRAFLERIGDRIATYVTVLEPLLRSEVPSDVAWSESRPHR